MFDVSSSFVRQNYLCLKTNKHAHIYTFHPFFSQVIQVASLSDQTLEVTAEEIQRLEGNEN